MKLHRFDVIVALYVFGIIVAQLMGAKVVPFGSIFGLQLSISVAVFLIPLLFTITDVVIEVHGKERARSLVRTGLLVVSMLAAYTLLVTSLPAAERYLPNSEAYNTIFGTSIRFALASIAAFFVAELMDVKIYSKLRDRMKHKGMWLRNNVSNFAGQLIDSTVFVVIAFYDFGTGVGANVVFLAGIILPYWGVRCLMSVAGTPLVYLGVAYLNKRDKANLNMEVAR